MKDGVLMIIRIYAKVSINRVSLFTGQLRVFFHASLFFLSGQRVVNIPFDRLIECCTYDVNSSIKKVFI